VKILTLSAFFVALNSVSIAQTDSPKKKTVAGPFDGQWIITGATWCNEPLPLFGKDMKESKTIAWSFEGNRFKSFIGGRPDAMEEGTFRIRDTKSGKHLDLMPTKGEILTTRKCLYNLKGDELKIAFSLSFAPSSPEEEIKTAKEMRAKRPVSLTPAPEDATLILTLKRKK
jgi:uncharacterized protein (TIGR03067 family)